MSRLINLGGLNIDYVYGVPSIARSGETVPSFDYQIFPGGKGLNQSLAAVKAGASVFHVGRIGQDGQWLKEVLAKCGVDVSQVLDTDGPSGHAVIQVNNDGENAIFTFGGANRQLTSDDVDRAFELCSSDDLLLIQNETNQLDYILSRLNGADYRVAFNAAPVDEKLMEYDLSNINVLIVNEVEAAALADTPDPTNALQNLCVRYPECDVVLSLGKDGLRYGRGGERLRLNAFTVQAVDETAAGDSFVGYFLAAILRGLPCDDALVYGSAAGALAVTLPGAAGSIPEATAVESLVSTDDLTI